MITYLGNKISVLKDSLSITKKKSQEIVHYPGTNQSANIELGREATVISCVIVAVGDDQRILWEQLVHDSIKGDFIVSDRILFKNVITGNSGDFKPRGNGLNVWTAQVNFIALDPISYNPVNGEAWY